MSLAASSSSSKKQKNTRSQSLLPLSSSAFNHHQRLCQYRHGNKRIDSSSSSLQCHDCHAKVQPHGAVFGCMRCKFYLCAACFRRPSCAQGHLLKASYVAKGSACSSCHYNAMKARLQMYQCHACKYSLCLGCYSNETCCGNHGLKWTKLTSSTEKCLCFCKKCRRVFKPNKVLFMCKKCKYALCGDCYQPALHLKAKRHHQEKMAQKMLTQTQPQGVQGAQGTQGPLAQLAQGPMHVKLSNSAARGHAQPLASMLQSAQNDGDGPFVNLYGDEVGNEVGDVVGVRLHLNYKPEDTENDNDHELEFDDEKKSEYTGFTEDEWRMAIDSFGEEEEEEDGEEEDDDGEEEEKQVVLTDDQLLHHNNHYHHHHHPNAYTAHAPFPYVPMAAAPPPPQPPAHDQMSQSHSHSHSHSNSHSHSQHSHSSHRNNNSKNSKNNPNNNSNRNRARGRDRDRDRAQSTTQRSTAVKKHTHQSHVKTNIRTSTNVNSNSKNKNKKQSQTRSKSRPKTSQTSSLKTTKKKDKKMVPVEHKKDKKEKNRKEYQYGNTPSLSLSATSSVTMQYIYNEPELSSSFDLMGLESTAPSEMTRIPSILTDCCICMERDKNVAFLPCGHYISCEQCAKALQYDTGMCAICNSKIQSILKIFE